MEKQLTPKEMFDAEMKEINAAISKKKYTDQGMSDEEAAEYVEEIEAAESEAFDDEEDEEEIEDEPVTQVELDKNLGLTSFSATNDDFKRKKLEDIRGEVLGKMKGVGGLLNEKLKPEDQMKMLKVLKQYDAGEIKNPVLLHFIKKKLDHVKEFDAIQEKAKQVQLEVVQKMAKITDEMMHAKAKQDIYNKDILELADQID